MPYSLVSVIEFAQLGIPAAATRSISAPDLQAGLDATSADAVAMGLRARYGDFIVSVGLEVKQRICDLYSWRLLKHRGFNPKDGADMAAKMANDEAMQWLRDVGGGLIHPEVTVSEAGGNVLPDTTGQPSRGWSEWARNQTPPVNETEV